MSRERIREQVRRLRDQQGDEERMAKSLTIGERLSLLEEMQRANCIAFYAATRGEVETDFMIESALKRGKIIVLPRVDRDTLIFYKIRNLGELKRGAFGILEPEGREESRVSQEEIELLVVPGLAFDESCNRLGYGKGYYDTFLGATEGKKVGISFDFQIVPKIGERVGDVRMDIIVTERRVIRCRA